jgi:hypothetical protein
MNDLDKRLKIMSIPTSNLPTLADIMGGSTNKGTWKGVSCGAKKNRKAETITMTNEH